MVFDGTVSIIAVVERQEKDHFNQKIETDITIIFSISNQDR